MEKYRAKARGGWKQFCFHLAVCSVLVTTTAAGGENITYDGQGSALQNTPWLSGGTQTNSLFPGTTASAYASNNSVTIDYATGTDPDKVYGGIALTGTSENNTVKLIDGAVTDSLHGGYADSGDALTNSVAISGGAVGNYAYGGFSFSGNAGKNAVTITGGTTKSVYGGLSNSNGNAYGNTVSATNITAESVTGGQASGMTGAAYENTVTLYSGTISVADGASTQASVQGGLGGSVHDNTVTIHNADVIASGAKNVNVYGGNGTAGTTYNNTVNITGGNLTTTGAGEVTVAGALGNGGETYGNTVNISGGSISSTNGSVRTYIYGANGNGGDVYGNEVNISSGSIGASGAGALVIGGHSLDQAVEVRDNKVTLSGDAIVTGIIRGGQSSSTTGGDVNNNQIAISGGQVDIVVGGYSHTGSASGNSVEITGGKVTNYVVAGWAANTNNTAGLEAKNNSVTISGDADLTTASLYGYSATNPVSHSGNTLNVHEYYGTSVASIAGNTFDNYDFIIPTSVVNNGDAALTVTNAVNISDSSVNIGFVSDTGSVLKENDKVVFLDATGGLTANNVTVSLEAKQGAFITYTLDSVGYGANDAYLRVRSMTVSPEAKTLAMGRIASLALLNQAGDLVADAAFDAARAQTDYFGTGWSKAAVFGAVGGGHFRHKTGSHVDVDGVSLLTGMAWRNNAPCGSLLLGAFFETGYGDYDTRNAFAAGATRGDGDGRYFGGGVMARYDWQSGFYAEASARIGSVENKFHSDLTASLGIRARYDISSLYFGAHAGVGYKWSISPNAALDLSAKYLWSRQSSEDAHINGERIDFEANNSHRLRTGARFTYGINNCVRPYVGAAFEYEFRGKAKSGVYGVDFGAPSLKGGTGIAEMGVSVSRGTFSADIGVQGHVGRRDGVSGTVRVGWNF